MATLVELQADLVKVETAWTAILEDKRVSRLSLGTGSTRRDYTMQEINQTLLLSERKRLQNEIAVLTAEVLVFRNSSVCHTRHRKL
jgi:hypothetical protein